MSGQLLTHHDAKEEKKQHVSPCSDCPWSRKALPGWLATMSVGKWLFVAHQDGRMECHTRTICGKAAQCAGAAIFRANVCKGVIEPNLYLPKDTVKVFAGDGEFASHHLKRNVPREEAGQMRLKVMMSLMNGEDEE